MPEDAPCCVLFRITEVLPAGAPQQRVKQAWERPGRGKTFLPAEGLVAYIAQPCDVDMTLILLFSFRG